MLVDRGDHIGPAYHDAILKGKGLRYSIKNKHNVKHTVQIKNVRLDSPFISTSAIAHPRGWGDHQIIKILRVGIPRNIHQRHAVKRRRGLKRRMVRPKLLSML
jgi:hypothetical protein